MKVLKVSRMPKRTFRRFDVTILIGASHPHHVFPSCVMPVVYGPEGIANESKTAFWRDDMTI